MAIDRSMHSAEACIGTKLAVWHRWDLLILGQGHSLWHELLLLLLLLDLLGHLWRQFKARAHNFDLDIVASLRAGSISRACGRGLSQWLIALQSY